MMLVAILGILIGFAIGFIVPYTYNASYSLYISMAIVASLDSVFGGVCAQLNGRFNNKIFLSGFIGNAIIAVLLAYLGDRLGIPLYYSSIVVFGIRIFNNFALIRRFLINRLENVETNKNNDNVLKNDIL